MFPFPELTVKCDTCGRRSVAEALATQCDMPQPWGDRCLGMFIDPDPKVTTEPVNEETVLITLAGVPLGFIKASVNPFPRPKVIVTERAKEAAAQAFNDYDGGPRKSMFAAVEAAGGIIAADNVEAIRIGIERSIPLLEALRRPDDAEMCRTIVEMLSEYVAALDPSRPKR